MEGALLSERVLACAIKVHRTLGVGFLEKVYENALMRELKRAGLRAEQQMPIDVFYLDDPIPVGEYCADIVVEGTLILELKAVRKFAKKHMACCMNYLKATHHPVCLLLNFGQTRLQIKRIVGEAYRDYPGAI